MKKFYLLVYSLILPILIGCEEKQQAQKVVPTPEYSLSRDQTHNKFSSLIPPVVTVPSGAIIEAYTEEASDGQFAPGSTVADVSKLDFEPIHPLTGPVYVEDAQVGDILAVTLHEIEMGNWGWTSIIPGFGFLADEFTEPYLKILRFNKDAKSTEFNDNIRVPLNPFPGVMGVAPATTEMLTTGPPRENGGNMDNPYLMEGTTVYFPVLVEGALFSIGDTHAAQGMGEVCGTGIEAPMRIIYEVNVIKSTRTISEPQYETDEYYAVSAYATTLDEAARKATRFMIDYLEEVRGMSRADAYVLCSLAGDLKIAEVVDIPNFLVAMHMPKEVFVK